MRRSPASSAPASPTPAPACTASSRSCERPVMSTPDTFTQLLQEELTPEPDPQFAAEMDEWVAEGFPPRDGRQPRRRPSLALGAWLDRAIRVTRSPLGLAGLGTAVAAVVIALVLVADSAQQTGSPSPGASSAGGDAVMPAPSVAAEPPSGKELEGLQGRSSLPGPVPPSSGGVAPGEKNRRIERSALMTLAAPADDFQST